MSQHITRKELKKDKFAEAVTHGVEEVATHQKQVWMVAGVALVIVLAIAGWRYWSERQTVEAQAAFEKAMKTFQARIRAVGEPEDPQEISYVDEKNKYTDAVKQFEQVAKEYSLTRPGRTAQYYVGLCYASLGDYENAQRWLRQVEGSSDEELASLARLQLAQVLIQLGKKEDGVRLYQQLMERPTTMVPKPTAMMALAEYYERAKNIPEAVKLYTQLKSEFKDSSYADQAEERLQELQPKT